MKKPSRASPMSNYNICSGCTTILRWRGTRERNVENYVRNCISCARAKLSRKKTHGTLLPLPTPEGPWQDISMDFIVAPPESTGPGDPGGTTYDSI